MDIIRTISSENDGEETCTIKIDRYDLDILVKLLSKIEPMYSDYAEPYTERWRDKRVIASLLGCARMVDIRPSK
jgi:hypothetical protein